MGTELRANISFLLLQLPRDNEATTKIRSCYLFISADNNKSKNFT